MIDITAWQILLVLNKVFIYSSIAAIIGGPLVLLLLTRHHTVIPHTIHKYHLTAAIVGLIALVSYLLFETAAFSESGIAGMFDMDTFLILWDSPIGQAALYRICSFSLFLAGYSVLFKAKAQYLRLLSIFGYFIIAFLLARSFSIIGHSTSCLLYTSPSPRDRG